MGIWNHVLWTAVPYICMTIFFGGHIYRYLADRGNWGARSSEILEKRMLSWTSPLFHYGTLAVIGGHVAGIVIPLEVYHVLGISDELYHLLAITLGGAAGVAMLIGVLGLIWRRLYAPRVRAITTTMDWIVLVLLFVLTALGVGMTLGYNIFAAPYEYRTTVAPFFRGIFVLRADPALMQNVPLLFKIHVFLSFILFAVWPFSRLVHVWSAPIPYLWRPYIPYRRNEYANAPQPLPDMDAQAPRLRRRRKV